MKYTVCMRICRSGTCLHKYTGEADSVHFWSEATAMADEIGHSFLAVLFRGGHTFSTFCDWMTHKYRNINHASAKFMSNATFVSCFFSWLSCMQIDFREHIDPYCGYNPKLLACDATHAGVAFRQLRVTPIERPEIDQAWSAKHRRFDRVFLADELAEHKGDIRCARKHLKYLCRLILSELPSNEQILDDTILKANNDNLLKLVPSCCVRLMTNFVNRIYDCELLHALACVLLLLSSDAPLSAFISHSQCPNVRTAVACINDGIDVENSIDVASLCFPELKPLLRLSAGTDYMWEVCTFVRYLCETVEKRHAMDQPSAAVEPIPSSYNPESGVAYYFTESGNQVRKLPRYDIDSVSKGSRVYDQEPSQEEKCTKRFPTTGQMGGYSTLFLWFCPQHGHCYGFHLIPKSEGRKDAFASIFKYLPTPPSNIFYDFACSLSEYCLNREPTYFRDVHFYHDIFHGYSHSCGGAFKATRNRSLAVNTSICEQFNSYLKKFKYVASHLTQKKYTFLLQYAIYLWNKRKSTVYEGRLQLALACLK